MIVVTGDSISMCSECCATGVPVSIFAPDEMIGPKHKRFLKALYEKGYASLLGQKPLSKSKSGLNPAFELADIIRSLK